MTLHERIEQICWRLGVRHDEVFTFYPSGRLQRVHSLEKIRARVWWIAKRVRLNGSEMSSTDIAEGSGLFRAKSTILKGIARHTPTDEDYAIVCELNQKDVCILPPPKCYATERHHYDDSH